MRFRRRRGEFWFGFGEGGCDLYCFGFFGEGVGTVVWIVVENVVENEEREGGNTEERERG